MTDQEIIEHTGELIRLNPVNRGGHGHHWGRGRLIGRYDKTRAMVLPFGGHRKTEIIEIRYLKVWKSKAA